MCARDGSILLDRASMDQQFNKLCKNGAADVFPDNGAGDCTYEDLRLI